MPNIIELINLLRAEARVFIQTHNFPDHDAIASAFALQELLNHFEIKSYIVYDGDIQRDSLKRMISILNIKACNYTELSMKPEDKIIIVDGCKGNRNVFDLKGYEIAVIDHHEVICPEYIAFSDIRMDYGSCSTIIYTYYQELGIKISREAATALMVGLSIDTALLTRSVSETDINVYASLYVNANTTIVNSILRNYIKTEELRFYRYAIDNIRIRDCFAFCYFHHGCNQNLLGILSDFFLALEEVNFVVLCAKNDDKINFSVRSELEQWNASKIIQKVLKDIGFGGGHSDMAGGMIKNINLFNENEIYEKFFNELT
ncbi:MAG: DHHA1 domain-containing protein [Bacillota bacterium]|nr:DHHA1 domain-containing protein [Bacillota bacterium]